MWKDVDILSFQMIDLYTDDGEGIISGATDTTEVLQFNGQHWRMLL